MSTARPSWRLNPLVIYTAALITALLWPFLLPGFLGLRDMVILDYPALTDSAFGFGDTPARNAPQDGILALVGLLIPAGWFARILILSTAVLGAFLSTLWVRDSSRWHKAAAITLTLWNPFVVERLLQGHWSLVLAAWLLPGIAAVHRTRSKAALIALCSLTPTGLVLGFLTAIWTSPRSTKSYGILTVITTGLALPWLIPSMLNAPMSFGTTAFVARAETFVGTFGALLGLGGIWNAAAVPTSRSTGFAIFGILLFLLLLRWMPRREALLGAVGFASCLLMTFGPVEWISETVPGAALFRDSHKLIILLLPAMVAAAARIDVRSASYNNPASRILMPALVIVLSILQVPDAPHAVRELTPHTVQGPWHKLEGKTLNADSSGLITFNGSTMVDPWTKATDVVAAGGLIVDGKIIDPPSAAYTSALEEWETNDLDALASRGINGVISNGQYHKISPAVENRSLGWTLGAALSTLWILATVALCFFAAYSRKRITS